LRHYLSLEIVPVLRGHFRFYCLRTVVLREQGIIIYNKPAVYWEQGKNVIRQRKDKEKKQEKREKKRNSPI
jgi:hypothetical protein